jgi:mono/diheme cytochrome c family protein
MRYRFALALVFLSMVQLAMRIHANGKDVPSRVSYKQDIKPLLATHCSSCHGAQGASTSNGEFAGGLRTDSYEGLVKGGDSGPAIVKGQPNKSPLCSRLVSADDRMPLFAKSALPERDRDLISRWIASGAPNDLPGEDTPKVVIATRPKPVSFDRDIQPILDMHCVDCHSARQEWWPRGFASIDHLWLDNYANLKEGSTKGHALVPGKPNSSRLVGTIVEQSDVKMPLFGERLSANQIALIRLWIAQGAKGPEGDKAAQLPLRSISLTDVSVGEKPFVVSCTIPVAAFLGVKVSKLDGTVLDWRVGVFKNPKDYGDASAPGGWAHWGFRPGKQWPEKVTVQLLIRHFTVEPDGTLFVLTYNSGPGRGNHRSDDFLEHDKNAFQPVPISWPQKGTLRFWLKVASDVAFDVFPQGKTSAVFSDQEFGLAAGKQTYEWDLRDTQRKAPVAPGAYVFRLHCQSNNPQEPQYDIAVLFRVIESKRNK